MTLICNVCNIEKELNNTNFEQYKSGTFRKICRNCRTNHIKLKQKELNKICNETKLCISCNNEISVNKFHGKICNSCAWKNKCKKKTEIKENIEIIPEDYAIKQGNFPKNCIECLKEFNKNEFKFDSQMLRYRTVCKECTNKRKYHTVYRNKKINENYKEYLNNNREIHILWKMKNPDKVQECYDNYKGNINRIITNIIKNMKLHGNIDLEIIDAIKPIIKELIQTECFYCGFFEENKYNTIDRLDSTKNYTENNIVPCCLMCNYFKNTLDISTFIKHIRKITKFNFDISLELFDFGLGDYQKSCAFYDKYKYRAKEKNICFDIDKHKFEELINSNCYYCNFDEGNIGIDRLNNNLGYSIKNIVPCCKICNYMKNKNSIDVFLDHCKNINDYINEEIIELCNNKNYNGIQTSRELKMSKNEIEKIINIPCNKCDVMMTGYCSKEHSDKYFITKQKK